MKLWLKIVLGAIAAIALVERVPAVGKIVKG